MAMTQSIRKTNPEELYGYPLTPDQAKIVEGLCAKVLAEVKNRFKDPDTIASFSNKKLVARYFVARDYEPAAAFEMWKKWLEWRLKDAPDKISEGAVINELKAGKAFWHGYDKKGHPCVVVKAKNHIPGEIPIEETVKYYLFMLERGLKKAELRGSNKICLIWDREGVTKRNFDSSFIALFRELAKTIQEFYAEICDKIYILHPSFLMRTVMSITKAFLAPRTREKLVVISDLDELKTYFKPEDLLVEHGGTSNFSYQWPYKIDDTDTAWYDCQDHIDTAEEDHFGDERDVPEEKKETIVMDRRIVKRDSFLDSQSQ